MRNEFSKKHYGVVVPMITPLTPSFDLDEESLEKLVEHVISGEVNGVFVLGTTGEASSLPENVRFRLVERTVDLVGGRAAVYAGIADDCLANAVGSATHYINSGVKSIVVRLPSYYPLSDSEQLDFLSVFIQEVAGEILIYNIPSLTKMAISIDTMECLSCHPRVVGIKDSTFDAGYLFNMIDRLGGRQDLSVFTGPAAMSVQMLEHGADGIIPALSNLMPSLCVDLYKAVKSADTDRAKELQQRLNLAGTICKGYAGPSALKCAMSVLGICGPTVMTPLQTLSVDDQKLIQKRMSEIGLLPEQLVTT